MYYRHKWNKLTLLFHFARYATRHGCTGHGSDTKALLFTYRARGGLTWWHCTRRRSRAAGGGRARFVVVRGSLGAAALGGGAPRLRAPPAASLSRYSGHEIFSQLSTGGGTQVRLAYLKAYFSLPITILNCQTRINVHVLRIVLVIYYFNY